MQCKSWIVLGVVLGAFMLAGCEEGPRIPPSNGAAARDEIEQPFGPPTNLKKKSAGVETKPRPAH